MLIFIKFNKNGVTCYIQGLKVGGGGEATYRNFDSKFSNIFFLLPLYIKNNQSLLGGNHTE